MAIKFIDIINENSANLSRAKKYLDDIIQIHGNDTKKLRKAITDMINSQYGQWTSNDFITSVWSEFNRRFPS